MARRTLPGMGLTGGYSSGDDGWHDEMNANLLATSVVSQLTVASMTDTLPGSPSNGMIYIVPTAGANQWKVAVRDNGAWVYLSPVTGWHAWVVDAAKRVRWTGSAWVDVASGGGAVAVKEEGSSVVATASALNFVGAGVTATDAGSGVATITIPGGGGGGSSGSEGSFTAPPVASGWTQQNFDGTKTHLADFTSPVNGVRLYEDIYDYGNTNLLRAALKAIPGTRWQATARLRRHTRMGNFMCWGLVIRDSGNGKSIIWGMNSEANGLGLLKMTNDTTYSSYAGLGSGGYQYDMWMRLAYDGTNCAYYVSKDGIWWRRIAFATSTNLWGFLNNPATHVGFGYNANNAGAGDLGQEVDLLSWELVTLP